MSQRIAVEALPTSPDIMMPPVRVGGVTIDAERIAREMQYHAAASSDEALQQAARALVVRELLNRRADELGLRCNKSGDKDDEEARLAALLDQELDVPEPDEASCRRFFEAHAERFKTPTRLQLHHILLAAAPDDVEARDRQYRLGQTLIADLQSAPERFTEFAQRHSACPSRDEGGQLGWLASGQTVEELDRALRHLPEGLHDRPLASRYGWHLIWIEQRHEGQLQPFDQIADRVRHTLREQATRRALRHYLLALSECYGVEGVDLDGDGPLMQ
ncbi:peptidylprolyl isomerase [Salinicola salarius]|jgi:peptidyl-prolyl cis-trans isomerase C|uniref:peptidylprolyl isomerase n=1 Tax=Salinicola salarius TaxID=430457 RepID=UPI000DA13706|nr:peptidylprolyl isomerase [Salinicola salarius]